MGGLRRRTKVLYTAGNSAKYDAALQAARARGKILYLRGERIACGHWYPGGVVFLDLAAARRYAAAREGYWVYAIRADPEVDLVQHGGEEFFRLVCDAPIVGRVDSEDAAPVDSSVG